jgi:hypothetical protein
LPKPQILSGVHTGDFVTINYSNNIIKNINSPSILINGNNITTDPNNMWCIDASYLTKDNNNVIILRFDLQKPKRMKGLRIWNYNAGYEGSCCGVKHVNILLDSKLHARALIRKAPGEMKFDYNQFLPLAESSSTISNNNINNNTSNDNSNSLSLSMNNIRKALSNPISINNINDSSSSSNKIKNIDLQYSLNNNIIYNDNYLIANTNEDLLDEQSDDDDLVTANNDLLLTSMNSFYPPCNVIQQYETPVSFNYLIYLLFNLFIIYFIECIIYLYRFIQLVQ